VWALIIIGLIEVSVVILMPMASVHRGFVFTRSKLAAVDRGLGARVIVIGDSTTITSVDTLLLEEITGEKAYNLGLVGFFQVTGSLLMLERALSQEAPEVVVLMHAYDVYARSTENPTSRDLITGFFHRPLDLRSYPTDPWRRGAWTLRALMANLIPSVWLRADIRNSAGYLLDHSFRSLLQEHRHTARHISENKGYFSVEKTMRDRIEEDLQAHLHRVRSIPFSCSEENRNVLDRIIRRCGDRGIDLILVPAPLYDTFLEDPATEAHMESLLQFLSELASTGPHVHLPEAVIPSFPLDMLSDSIDHLNSEGARHLTERIAGWVHSHSNLLPSN